MTAYAYGMQMRVGFVVLLMVLSGCVQRVPDQGPVQPDPAERVVAPTPAPPPPAPTARTQEQFDTTTQDERVAALDTAPTRDSAALGTTIASLGNPAEPGFWLKTPLVDQEQEGQISYNGQSATVTLRPIEGPDTAGSRISLAAMRVLNAPLTDLVELTVFTR